MRSCVFGLHNGGNFARLVAHDAPVGTGLFDIGGEHGNGITSLFVEVHQFAQGFGAKQGYVAVGDQHGTINEIGIIEGIKTDFNGSTGAGNVVLINDGDLGIKVKNMLGYLITLVPHHNG